MSLFVIPKEVVVEIAVKGTQWIDSAREDELNKAISKVMGKRYFYYWFKKITTREQAIEFLQNDRQIKLFSTYFTIYSYWSDDREALKKLLAACKISISKNVALSTKDATLINKWKGMLSETTD